MPNPATAFLKLFKPIEKQEALALFVASRLDELDGAIAGYQDLSLQGLSGNVVLDVSVSRKAVVRLKDVPTAAVTVQVPATTGANAEITFVNACTGSFSTVTVKSTGANSDNAGGVSIRSGETRKVRQNGNSVFLVASPFGPLVTSFAPVVTVDAGSGFTATAVCEYVPLSNDLVYIELTVTVTSDITSGGPAHYVNVTLPFPTPNDRNRGAVGVEVLNTGKTLSVIFAQNLSIARFRFYDNSYPGAVGNSLSYVGTYRRA